jgi:hypothetical protein
VAKIEHCGENWTLWRKLKKVAKIAIFVAKIKCIIDEEAAIALSTDEEEQ